MIDSFSGDYRFLSNFTYCTVMYEGHSYNSTEAAYQAAKTLSEGERERFRTPGLTPGQAKRLGQRVTLRADWDNHKLGVMRRLLEQKFALGSELAYKLLATGDEELVEGNHWNDTFWGVCNGVGQNHLGKLLMQIRSELRLVEAEGT